MVKKIIPITIVVLLMTSYSVAKAQQKNFTVEELFGSYRAVSLMKVGYCHSNDTREAAEEYLNKKVILSTEYFNSFWREVQNPQYKITQHTPAKEEGEVYPRYLRRLFQTNGIYEDQVILLTVYYPENSPFKDLEIVDSNTLLYRSGCWTYTLKRIK